MEETKSITKKPSYSKETFLKRRIARLMAVQSLYAVLLMPDKETNIDKAIYDIINLHKTNKIDTSYSQSDESYLINIARGTFENSEQIDKFIQKYLAQEWRIDRLGKVIQCILRVSVYELQKATNLDAAIVINEYLEITKHLNHSGEVGFINSVLDQVAKELKRV